MKLAKRWILIIHAIRMFTVHETVDGKTIHFDSRDMLLKSDEDTLELRVIDVNTGEILVIYDEDGCPIDLSDWADSPMDVFTPTCFPVYSN